jgi:hypothetical protein
MGEAGMITTMSTFSTLSFPILGFGYALNSLPQPGAEPHSTDKSENELARAFATIFSTHQQFRILNILAVWFPFLRRFVRPPFSIDIIFDYLGMSYSAQSRALSKTPKPQCSV